MTYVFDMMTGFSGAWSTATGLLLDVAIKGAFLMLLAAALALLLQKASAATRHLVWSVAVVGLLVLPAVSVVAPKWVVPGISISMMERSYSEGVVGGGGAAGSVAHVASEGLVASKAYVSSAISSGKSVAAVQLAPVEVPAVEARVEPARVVPAGVRVAAATLPSVSATPPPPTPSSPQPLLQWSLLLPGIWLMGTVAVLLWILGGLIKSWLLVRSAKEVEDGPLAWLFDELSDELDLRGKVTLLQTNGSTMPMVWGIRSKVLLPADADDWTDDRLRAVLLHELAHVKRRDYLTQLMARFAGALYWFNPLVWVAIHRMRVEREHACDDEVLCTGSKASDYASHLLEIARAANTRAYVSVGGVAMARRSKLSDRLLAVLDDNRRRATVSPRMATAAWSGAFCFLLPLAGAGFQTVENVQEPPVPEPVAAVSAIASIEPMPEPVPVAMPEPIDGIVSWAPPPAPTASVPTRTPSPAPMPMLNMLATQGRCDWYDREANTSTWMSGEDDQIQLRITTRDCRLEVEIDGEIVFNDAETDIVDISRRGYFEMEEREGRFRRRIVIEPTGGDLERRWYVDGDERPYDREAAEWLQEMIPVLFRRVGLQAEERALRILQEHGVDGVLEEISLIPSDYISRKYYQVLLTEADLSTSQLQSIVRQAGAEIESDYELAQLLVEVAENHPVDESVMVVYVEAAGSLESDYEQRRVLDTILSRQNLSPEVAERILRMASDLESDYELAELLIALLDRHPVDEALTTEFFEVLHTLESDYEHNRVLKLAIREGAPNLQVLDLALESAIEIDSDYERAELLLEVANLYPVDESIPPSYLEAATELDSDYELTRVLKFLIRKDRLSEDALATILDASFTIDSEYELATLLIAIADEHDLSGDLRDLYMRVADSISSDYERGRVLSALNPRGRRPN